MARLLRTESDEERFSYRSGLRSYPRFRFEEESKSVITTRVGTSLLLLFVPALLLSAGAAWRLKHFPVVG
jgi:hypothetical protein